jgi:L-alanine-DL-glutamate epimerase-like enolase superfamily enzyme
MANGGLLETIKWAFFAELHHIMIAPHHACSPVSLVSCAHIDACIPNMQNCGRHKHN